MAVDLNDVKPIKHGAENGYFNNQSYSEKVYENDGASDEVESIVVIPAIPGYEGSCSSSSESLIEQSDSGTLRETAENTDLDSTKHVYTCFHCNFMACTIEQLKVHILTHIANLSNICQFNNYNKSKAIELRKPISTRSVEKQYEQSEGKIFKCTICDYKSSRIYNVRNHMKIHSGERPYKCNICTYKSTEKSALNTHLSIHTEDKPFVCSICDYKTARVSSLKCHVRKHTGEKPYACRICDYRAKWKSTLKKHMRNHSSEIPFICETCNYKAATESLLNQHVKIHNGLKQHTCHICNYTTTKMSNLKRHSRIHIGEKFNTLYPGNPMLADRLLT